MHLHRDAHNSQISGRSPAFCFNFPSPIPGNYISFIFYCWKSIDDYGARYSMYSPIIQDVRYALANDFESNCHDTNNLYLYLQEMARKQSVSLQTMSMKPCIEPLGYHSLGLVCLATTIQELRPSLYEIFSIVNCVVHQPNSFEPLLQHTIRLCRGGRPRTHKLNRFDLDFLFQLKRSLKENREHGNRYNTYGGVLIEVLESEAPTKTGEKLCLRRGPNHGNHT